MTPLQAALALAREGFAVFPCGPGGSDVPHDDAKIPLGRAAPHGCLSATTDPGIIREWWIEYPSANLGIATGSVSGNVVVVDLDLDPEKGLDGLARWAELSADHPLVVTRTHRTPRGGVHMLFRAPAGVKLRNSTSKLAPGIDIRGDGGYIVAPPSRSDLGEWSCDDPDQPIAEMPPWLLEKIQGLDQVKPKPKVPMLSVVRGASTPYGLAALEGELEGLRGVREGGRNAALNKAAFAAGTLIGGGELDRGRAEDELLKVAAEIGLRESESIKTIRSGITKGMDQPRSAPPRASRGGYLPEDRDREESTPSASKASANPPVPLPLPLGGGDKNVPTVTIVPGQLHIAVKEGLEAVAKDPRVFERGLQLVTISRWAEHQEIKSEKKKIDRQRGAPVITPISSPKMTRILGECIHWEKWNSKIEDYAACDPPPRLVAGVHEDGEWPGTRDLVGLTEAPILHADGSVHVTPGYDPESGLFYCPNGAPPGEIAPLSQEDARLAVEDLYEVICDIPWLDPAHRVVWISALFTPLARAICPTVPLHAFDANCPGIGKSLCADTIALIVSGHDMPRGIWVEDDDEMRKRIFAHASNGDSSVLIDNIPPRGAIGWPSLDAALTAAQISDRVLGESRTATLPNNMSFVATGNNMSVRGDSGRRTIIARLETAEERPEERDGFLHPEIKDWLLETRNHFLSKALGVLAGYIKAGKPNVGVKKMGSFEKWSVTVRNALIWAGAGDPCAFTATKTEDADPEVDLHYRLLDALAGYPGITISDMLESGDDRLLGVLQELCPGREGPTARKVGNVLKAMKGRARGGRRIVGIRDPHRKIMLWKLEHLTSTTTSTSSTTTSTSTPSSPPGSPPPRPEIVACDDDDIPY